LARIARIGQRRKKMMTWFKSIRSIVTLIIVLTFCGFIGVYVYIGKLEGQEGLRALEVVTLLVLGYYFSMKKRNGDEPEPPVEGKK